MNKVTNYINKSRSNHKNNKCCMTGIAVIIRQIKKTKTIGNLRDI